MWLTLEILRYIIVHPWNNSVCQGSICLLNISSTKYLFQRYEYLCKLHPDNEQTMALRSSAILQMSLEEADAWNPEEVFIIILQNVCLIMMQWWIFWILERFRNIFYRHRCKYSKFNKSFQSTCTCKVINSLWPNDTIWRHRSGSALAQVMACCLMAPSHYLTHRQWGFAAFTQGSISQENLKISSLNMCLKI